jgi:hypothetical protein
MSTTTENQTLILSGKGYELTVAPEAEAMKAELLKHASLVVEVSNESDSEAARSQIKKLAAMRNAVEKSRKIVKDPVLQVGKDIDAKASEFAADIHAEEKRITKLVEEHAAKAEAERQRIMREMEAKRREEERQAREAEAARAKAEREAEEARAKAEAALWADDEDEAAKDAEAARIAQEEAAKKAAEEEAAREAVKPVLELVPAKATGVKFTYDFEVTDIHALYRYASSLVKMEAKRSKILEHLKELPTADPEIPGLRVFKKPVVSTR